MNFSIYILLFLCLVGAKLGAGLTSNRIFLSNGVINWDQQKMNEQYNLYKVYASLGLITDTSVLTYGISESGLVTTHESLAPNTSVELYQKKIKHDFGFGAYPCFFCDSTIGICDDHVDFMTRVRKMLVNQNAFINITIKNALDFGWNGYYVDFEFNGSFDDSDNLTHFIIKWAHALHKYNRTLNIWIGGPTQYNMTLLYMDDIVLLTTMNTYGSQYIPFLNTASSYFLNTNNISRLSFGFLTYNQPMDELYRNKYIKYNRYYNMNTLDVIISEYDVVSISNWAKLVKPYSLSLWASIIPAHWYSAMQDFLKN